MNLKLTQAQALPKGAILVRIKPLFEYKEGEKTELQIGLIYVVLNCAGYDKVNVKVKSLVPLISKEEIEESPQPIFVAFEGFEGSVYSKDGSVCLSGKAEAAVLV